ncbi:hypothetical protein OK349_00870 [Sphingomonas sp. BT-65]|uniref:YkvI family membrane protein n=1 Tax=Sphingomonas sp. BT-65 TaxID=2989821 RepID=UPI002235AAB9|nr:hypothetical protein [Sphingomonas sp. BT-65]MCW4460245.1 hypothetical protein [Sphingomonas sp. BT-65]
MSAVSTINRYLLPGFAFKAVVIGGGYATGRELVEFFMPAGPTGGLWGMLLAMAMWSVICAITFRFAYAVGATDYQSFFRPLLGRFDVAFEIIYFGFLILVLSVFGSAAGAIGAAMFGLPHIAGTLALVVSVLIVCAAGQSAAEAVFKYVSVLLYGVYAIFLVLVLWSYTPQIRAGFAMPVPTDGWFTGGVTYASYNIIGAVLILPVLRHLRSRRDAVISGLLAGPLAMAPAIAFFVCLVGFYPGIVNEELPSNYVLDALGSPLFHFAFQTMVFFALLECSVGFVQAFNARIDAAYARRGKAMPQAVRIAVPAAITIGSVFIASAIGLVALIANGYRAMAIATLVVFVLPLLTLGVWRLWRGRGAD